MAEKYMDLLEGTDLVVTVENIDGTDSIKMTRPAYDHTGMLTDYDIVAHDYLFSGATEAHVWSWVANVLDRLKMAERAYGTYTGKKVE